MNTREERSQHMTIRVNAREHKMLHELAEHEGISVSDLVRQWFHREHARTFVEDPPPVKRRGRR